MKIKYYVINLDQYPEKYRDTVSELGIVGIDSNKISRKSGVVGKDLTREQLRGIVHPSVYYYMEIDRRLHDQIPGLGGIGCYLSHAELWQQLLKEPDDDTVYCIVEDDVKVRCNKDALDTHLSQLPKDWEFVYLGYARELNMKPKSKTNGDTKYYKQIGDVTHGLQFYIINKSGAKKLLQQCLPITHQVDSYIGYMALYGDLRCYRAKNSLFRQKSHTSSIQDQCVHCGINSFSKPTLLIIIVILTILILYNLKKLF